MKKIKILYCLFVSLLFFSMSAQNQKVMRKISRIEAEEILNKMSYREDTDQQLSREVEKYYILEDKTFLVIYDFVDEAVLFPSKEFFLDFMSSDIGKSRYLSDIEELISNKETLINELAKKTNLKISCSDRIQKLQLLDSHLKRLAHDDILDLSPQIFAYLFSTIYNEIDGEGWEYRRIDEHLHEIIMIDKNGKMYPNFYDKFWELIYDGSKDLSLYLIAKVTIYPSDFKLNSYKDIDIPD
ncbi:hypothetical protein [Flagellimonas meishanensis]|uniref:hypothetical protein n=1 Tax=Flagellimonas meishanensis TaxID=2873264 RepID=UPI001CA69596|nr:hypothetical protein [[Muricauda] meishanensis]